MKKQELLTNEVSAEVFHLRDDVRKLEIDLLCARREYSSLRNLSLRDSGGEAGGCEGVKESVEERRVRARYLTEKEKLSNLDASLEEILYRRRQYEYMTTRLKANAKVLEGHRRQLDDAIR